MPRPSAQDCFDATPIKTLKHSTYFAVYDREFERFRGRNITFVEVGVAHGGGLLMWRAFFGPKARIIGVDVNPAAKKWETEGFEIYIGDQADPDFWVKFFDEVGDVDIVFDDGGHSYRQQIITAEGALPHINDDGLLVVEDTHTSYAPGYGGPHRYSFIEYAKNKVDGISRRFATYAEFAREDIVFSVRFYESILIFDVNRALASTQSRWAKTRKPRGEIWDFYMGELPWVKGVRSYLRKRGWFDDKRRHLANGIMIRLNRLARLRDNRRLSKFFRFK